MDTFDSSYPTKAARHGVLFLKEGVLKITRTSYRDDFSPIDPNCSCHTCQTTSRAYLHHLFKAKEFTAHTLASIHNLHTMNQRMKDFRNNILANNI